MKIAPSLLALAVGLLTLGVQAEETKPRFRVHTDTAPAARTPAKAPAAANPAAASSAPAAASAPAAKPAPAVSTGPSAKPAGAQRAPWDAAPVAASAVPAVYLAEWKKAKNRARCAPLALVGGEKTPGVSVRRANFSDGWAVAYDLPGQRSAYGVAGTGLDLDGKGYTFPNSMTFADGSSAHYGLSGGTGPGYIAYVEVAGQRCLYNVWADVGGQQRLEELLRSLRKVQTP
ncbi:hypothetical protein SAMN04487939_114100 [Lysobacter sp. yr284]|uniref:hypothetical protein n=1 Tax=Lysobacter sp. yr284 TaxID=1761791 RepID=UPI00089C8340|nr:hypothetical protein [Lysobacter sp. yr284]SDZ07307.1 hypothetical protein SAMN04487939_114100 [Lysobacter sp. yr284]